MKFLFVLLPLFSFGQSKTWGYKSIDVTHYNECAINKNVGQELIDKSGEIFFDEDSMVLRIDDKKFSIDKYEKIWSDTRTVFSKYILQMWDEKGTPYTALYCKGYGYFELAVRAEWWNKNKQYLIRPEPKEICEWETKRYLLK